MPLQNRVTPFGEIVATAARGTLMGNRGRALHGPDRALGSRRWISKRWISCRLSFGDRRREVMSPGSYTELFFLDEATALAAGHRPCFECRRAEATAFARAWSSAGRCSAPPRASAMDTVLHAERIDPATGEKRLHAVELDRLPAGVIVLAGPRHEPHLVLDDCLRPWTVSGYGTPVRRPRRAVVRALTPPGIISAMNFGYAPMLHETALDRR